MLQRAFQRRLVSTELIAGSTALVEFPTDDDGNACYYACHTGDHFMLLSTRCQGGKLPRNLPIDFGQCFQEKRAVDGSKDIKGVVNREEYSLSSINVTIPRDAIRNGTKDIKRQNVRLTIGAGRLAFASVFLTEPPKPTIDHIAMDIYDHNPCQLDNCSKGENARRASIHRDTVRRYSEWLLFQDWLGGRVGHDPPEQRSGHGPAVLSRLGRFCPNQVLSEPRGYPPLWPGSIRTSWLSATVPYATLTTQPQRVSLSSTGC